ncbi:MAG TPA: acyl-[ACP]--phospholipid O-acyltransferase, partial [Candidatus Acidoferrum sp.]|nr:acyl-[ACP]--phospholipid O-acyltransferase [Candidatus Acidoferrum sp.]
MRLAPESGAAVTQPVLSRLPDGAGTGLLEEPMKPAADPAPEDRQRGFWALIVTQFQVAFSDNVLKWLVISLIAGMGYSNVKRDELVGVVGALFALPFILFSMFGGFLADRFSKRSVTIGVKLYEIFVMLLALCGLAGHGLYLAIACIFLMEVHSAIFGPSKYGLLPELLPEKKLSWGNGVLELGTFVAIISGTVVGASLCKTFAGRQVWSGVVLVALAAFGFFASFGISKVPAADPARQFHPNFLTDLWRQIKRIRQDRVLWLATLGNAYFTGLGALLQFLIVIYAKDVLHFSDPRPSSYLQAASGIGIGLGSFAAGYLSGGKIEYGLIPLGSIGMTVLAALLGQHGLSFATVAVEMSLLGFFGGFFIVPIAALLQHRPDKASKGGVLAAANLLSFVGVFAASGVYDLVTVVLHLNPSTVFLLTAVVTLAGTVYVLWLLPDAVLRFALWMLTRTLYRVRVLGRDNIPEKGGALFVCNHVSFVDALLLIASTDRRVRFVMYAGIYELPWIKPFARILGAIPISSAQRPRDLLHALRTATEAIRAGDVVCIFAEGQITRIGQLLPFRRGMEQIMKDVDAPVVPVALDGVWGSIFSFEKRRFVWKLPRRIPYPVTVSFGPPMPPRASASEVRHAVQELLASAWDYRRGHMLPLPRAFVLSARRHPFRFAMADSQSPKVTFASALMKTIFLARRLKMNWAGQQKVGLLLPPSVPGALANFAALLLGKVPVNLNYTLSEQTLASCIRQCDIKTVLTSRAFLEKVKLSVPCEMVFLEDRAARPRAGEKLAAFFMAWFLPVRLLQRALGCARNIKLDDLATVIFSSGSTGEPKGVLLSHYNIGSNIEQMEQVFSVDGHDCFLGVLPFFHSFGFTGTLCLPAVLGAGVVYHPNPLDAKAIGPLVCDHKVTFLLATPTFLQLYMRGCAAEQFGSLRVVAVSAEKLPDRLAAAFEEQFGIRPFEAYGCTECAPAVAVNTHDFRSAGFRQVGVKRGKIGHPLPGVCVRIVDAETGQPVPLGQPGLLLVRGPNVMQGYLGRPEKSAEVLRDGWYVTGDIAALDEDGFLQITDRLSRFSKIGGEMVPHIRVEEKLHELAAVTEQTFVVAGVPDEKKGERLVVLHKLGEARWAELSAKLPQLDLPNLWKPRADQFYHVEVLPILGTG